MTFGSLFAGIGGIDLGLERAGMRCAWQVEIDDYCTKVLQKHWPYVPRWRDVREVGRSCLAPVDLIAGGFPCQDISQTGKRVGIDGEQSGLWGEFSRIIRELRPKYVFVENVPALLGQGLGRVLGDLAESGYDAEWDCLPAAAFGAHHVRDRVFIIASGSNADFLRPQGEWIAEKRTTWGKEQFERLLQDQLQRAVPTGKSGGISVRVPNRMDRLRALGNSVVPQVAEWIGRRILMGDSAE